MSWPKAIVYSIVGWIVFAGIVALAITVKIVADLLMGLLALFFVGMLVFMVAVTIKEWNDGNI